MGNMGNVYFVLEIVAAEVVFFYAYPRRKYFVVRCILSAAVIFTLAYFFPTYMLDNRFLSMLIRYIVLWGLTVAGMFVCFSASVPAVLSSCAAGYALQHFSYKLTGILELTGMFDFLNPTFITRGFARELMVFPFTYVAAFFTFGRLAAKTQYYKNTDIRFIVLSFATIAVCIVLNRFVPNTDDAVVTLGTSLYAMTCTLFALFVQYSLRRSCEVSEEKAIVQKVLQEKEKQFESSMTNAELINIKCHDLKYAISRFDGRLSAEEIASVTALIDSYEHTLKTGCSALDVLLGEIDVRLRKQEIDFTFMGDATRLSAMPPADIWSLFGNALDNAEEAVEKLPDPEMRRIGMTIEYKEELVFVCVYNYYDGWLDIVEGLPLSTKASERGYHGYGLKSIRLIAKKYGGDISVSAENGIFNLVIRLRL